MVSKKANLHRERRGKTISFRQGSCNCKKQSVANSLLDDAQLARLLQWVQWCASLTLHLIKRLQVDRCTPLGENGARHTGNLQGQLCWTSFKNVRKLHPHPLVILFCHSCISCVCTFIPFSDVVWFSFLSISLLQKLCTQEYATCRYDTCSMLSLFPFSWLLLHNCS